MALNVVKPATLTANADWPATALATLSNGGFVIAYQAFSRSDGTDYASTQVFDGNGNLVGSASVPTFVTAVLDVGGLAGGGYGFAFDGLGPASGDAIGVTMYDANGGLTYGPGILDVGGFGSMPTPMVAVAPLANGGYAVSWYDMVTSAGTSDLFTAIIPAQGGATISTTDVSNVPAGIGAGGVIGHAAQANGGYALGWMQTVVSTPTANVYLAEFDGAGQEIGAPIEVSAGLVGTNSQLQIAALSNGDYAVTFQNFDPSSTDYTIYTAVYDGNGQAIEAPTLVAHALFPHIAALAGGNYALVWAQGGDIDTAVYNASGQQVSAPVGLSHSSNATGVPQVAVLSNGDYAVTWEQFTGGSGDIFVAVCNAQGQEIAGPIDASNSPGVDDTAPQITALAGGAFALLWQAGNPPSGYLADLYTAVYQFTDTTITDAVSFVGSDELQLDLSAIFDVGGDVTISGNGQLVSIDLSNLLSVGGNLTLTNNGALLSISLPSLTAVAGNVDLSGNTAATAINVASLAGATGNVTISGDTAATTIDLSSLASVTGNVDISGDTSATAINVGSLASVTGNVTISGDTAATAINVGSLAGVTGNVDISGDTAATVINVGSLAGATGNVTISGDAAAGTINLSSLAGVTGNVDISGDTAATAINVGGLAGATGNVTISSDTAAGMINLASLASVTGNVGITGNTTAITIDLGALLQAGALIVSNNGVVTLDLSSLVHAGGDVAITNNTHLLTVDLPHLASVGGNLTLSANTSATAVNLDTLGSVGGNLTIANDTSVGTVSLGSLSAVGGNLDITGDTAATAINLGSLGTVGGNLTVSDDTSAAAVDLGSVGTVGGDITITGDSAAASINLGNLTAAGGNLTISNDASATTINLGDLSTTGGNLTINTAADATLDASALGPGGGTVRLIGDNLTTAVTLGSLDQMAGVLTVTSADGVTLTSHAGLATLTISGTPGDDTLIGSARAQNIIDGGAGNDVMTGGAGDDTLVFDLQVSQHTEVRDVAVTTHHHDFVNLASLISVAIGGLKYDKPAPTAAITAWKNWDEALTTWANRQPDNTGGDHSLLFTNSNPGRSGRNVGTIQLTDGYFHDYDTIEHRHQTITVSSVVGNGFDTITNFSNQALTCKNDHGGNDTLVFNGLSTDQAAANYWGKWLDSTTACGDTIIHVHDVAHHGADVSAIRLVGTTTDISTLVRDGIAQFHATG